MGAAGDTGELPGVTVGCPVLWGYGAQGRDSKEAIYPIARPSEKHGCDNHQPWTVTGGIYFQGMKALIKLL